MKFFKYALTSLYVFCLGLVLSLIGVFARPEVLVERVVIQSRVGTNETSQECIDAQSVDSTEPTSVSVVVLSDFHFGAAPFEKITQKHLQQVIDQTNALEPDLVLLLGDYVDYHAPPITVLCDQWLAKLQPKHGTFAVLGNHDYKTREHALVTRELERVGIRVLSNERCLPIDRLPWFELIGVGDVSEGKPEFDPEKAMLGTTDETYKIVMSHNPRTTKHFARWPVDLQISGHLHGGQIRTPWGYPVLGFIRFFFDLSPLWLQRFYPHQVRFLKDWNQAEGLHRINRADPLISKPSTPKAQCSYHEARNGWNFLYVSRGLGTHYPMRTYCPLEVSHITLLLKPRTGVA